MSRFAPPLFETGNLKLGKGMHWVLDQGILSVIFFPYAKPPVVVPITRNYAAASNGAKNKNKKRQSGAIH